MVVSRQPLTANTRIRSQASGLQIFGGTSGTEIGLSPSTSASPATITQPMLRNHHF